MSVTCPRCGGFEHAFARHAHVNGGRCLLCNGALEVTAAQAGAFFAAASRQVEPAPDRWNYESAKPVTLPALGIVRIGRTSDSRFALMSVHPEAGLLVSTFGISSGRVWLESVCGGHLAPFGDGPAWAHESDARRKMALRAELQGALR